MRPKSSRKFSNLAAPIVASGVWLASGGPTWGHHSFAMFNHNQVATVSGTIGAIQWRNPHVWVWVYVPKKRGGGYDLYGFESNTVSNIARLGWKKDSLKVGDKVSVRYFPLFDSQRHAGYFIEAQRPDGSTVVGDTAASAMTEASEQPTLELTPPKDIAPPK
jgi:hypothetical protein